MKKQLILTVLALALVGCNHDKTPTKANNSHKYDTPDVKDVYFSGQHNGDKGIKDDLFFPNGTILNAGSEGNKTNFVVDRDKNENKESVIMGDDNRSSSATITCNTTRGDINDSR